MANESAICRVVHRLALTASMVVREITLSCLIFDNWAESSSVIPAERIRASASPMASSGSTPIEAR